MKVRVLSVSLSILASGLMAATPDVSPDAVVAQYCAATASQEQTIRSASMEVDIDASLPGLQKHGKLHALRRISSIGRITYDLLGFEGDGTIKTQVIARYLTAEAEAQKSQSPSLAVTPDNYKFKYKGRNTQDGRDVYVYQVTPRKKRPGLYKGEVWIDAATYLRVRESGTLVKNPSFFLKRVDFVRNYDIRDGIAVPRRVQSVANVRMVGKAELTIDFTHFALDNQTRAEVPEGQ